MSRLRSFVPGLAAACVFVMTALASRDAGAAPVLVPEFGPNPGNLDMFAYSPASAGDQAPLVLVLHGCTQQVASMAAGGFEPLADEFGFHLVFPQQKSANNPVNCFNWAGEFGDPTNLVRGQGENQSIASMIDKMKTDHSIDPARVFIIGFSAGGGMASVMLATWPDLFAAGAIASGIPYRCATTVQGAFDCQNMNLHPERKKTPAEWGDLVRAAFPEFIGPYPRVMILHGTADFIVHSDNAIELDDQWTDVHGIDTDPEIVEQVGTHTRSQHLDDAGKVSIESWRVMGMGHAFPIGQDPERTCGTVGAFFEDRDLCGAYRALVFFGITGGGGPGPADAGPPLPDANPCSPGSGKADLREPDDQGSADVPRAGGCAAGSTGGAGAAMIYVVFGFAVAVAFLSARRRRSTRSILPAPVRGSSARTS